MICALMIGRKGSVGFPGKNVYPVLGRPLAAYPLMAARAATRVDRLYVSTDCPQLTALASDFGAECIERPHELATTAALGEHVFVHGFQEISRRLQREGQTVDLMVLLFANAPTVTAALIDEGVAALERNPDADSAVSTSVYNMWSPLRARRLDAGGHLQPFVPFETFGDPATLSCDRDSQGDVYYADMGVSVVRPRCLTHLEDGLLPQKWMGRTILPIPSWGGCDVDYEWQIPLVEHWLRAHGVAGAE
jgi:CMP-N-acetylneuraminic acid synthetase